MALLAYRSLMRAQKRVFFGDLYAQQKAKEEIRMHYQNNKDVTDEAKINELIQFAKDCQRYLEGAIIRASRIEGDTYKLNITDKTFLTNNREPTPPLSTSLPGVPQGGCCQNRSSCSE